MNHGQVENLFIGRPKELVSRLDKKKVFLTGIEKSSVQELDVRDDEIIGDQCHLLKHHGGPDRVLHQMSQRAYDLWHIQYPQHRKSLVPGAVGENLFSSSSMHDGNVCLGDTFQIGGCQVQITEGRNPCNTIDAKVGVPGIYQFIKESCVSGWFYRILKPGLIRVGDEIKLVERLHEDMTVERAFQVVMKDKGPEAEIQACKSIAEMSGRWKETCDKILSASKL